MTNKTQVRELNRLKKVFMDEIFDQPDEILYVTESSRVEVELNEFSRYTFRRLVEFLTDESERWGHKIERRKNNIIINSRVLNVLISDRLECLNQIKRSIEIIKAYKVGGTELTQSLVLNLIGRWWSEIPPEIGRSNSRKRAWYFYDNDDLIKLLDDKMSLERKQYQEFVEVELKIEEYYHQQLEIKRKKEEKAAKKLAKEMLTQQRKEVRERNKARKAKKNGLDKV